LASITLPDTANETIRIHLFSMSLWKQTGVQIQHIRPTQKHDLDRVQTVELIIDNAGPDWISGDGVEVSITAPGIHTVKNGYIKRLRPGDQKKINVGVIGCGNVAAEVHLSGSTNTTFSVGYVNFGLEEFTSDLASLDKHETPEWFDDAKYGIFIHWGPYCVPGWGNSTPWEIYAEWYWWYGSISISQSFLSAVRILTSHSLLGLSGRGSSRNIVSAPFCSVLGHTDSEILQVRAPPQRRQGRCLRPSVRYIWTLCCV
jgi:hypothetical protein